MLRFKTPIEALLKQIRKAREAAPSRPSGKIVFNRLRMESAPPWNAAPAPAELAAVTGSLGPFPELRDKDL
ncbi:hypothetical protein [Roseateles terrae]|uniref:Uncharacterized protein n=1 Tax=Roseateles terrae TaxID=431060 RepID=A0ABR6GQ09_9BURK|nr:hypothetical protein [Roseateles terrae]MBB3194186.1 hypothetical protein [Roseateles terrae]OWQ88037.1 hypothetical protein CDN98_07795 [Roseateles terrae]